MTDTQALRPLLLATFLGILVWPAAARALSEAELRAVILRQTVLQPEQRADFDVNGDGVVDVADIIRLFKAPTVPALSSVVGRHVGIMYPTRGSLPLVPGQGETVGHMPILLTISSESPALGEIDNRSGSGNVAGHYSLYFPNAQIPVAFETATLQTLRFTATFDTVSPNLVAEPPHQLRRVITFEARAASDNNRVMEGTYVETIAGFEDNRGRAVPIDVTGRFVLFLSND